MLNRNYSLVAGGTFRKRIPRSELQEFTSILNDGKVWVGKVIMQVTATDEYLELLIQNTTSLRRGDNEYKVIATNEFGDHVILIYGRLRVLQ